jgi:hypothetical protein
MEGDFNQPSSEQAAKMLDAYHVMTDSKGVGMGSSMLSYMS